MKTKIHILNFVAFFVVLTIGIQAFAQEEAAEPDRRPVTETFNSSLLVDQTTNMGPYKGGLELIIHHRFGTMNNGLTDLAGVYAASNIRLGFLYGINERLSVGIGTERYNKMQDLYAKYTILQQRRTGMPISVGYMTQIGIDARDKAVFGKDTAFIGRISYFNQVIVSRKFNSKLSMQFAPSFIHFNAVDSTKRNDYIGISAGGRFKVYNEMSIIATYDQGFALMGDVEYDGEKVGTPKASFGLGLEIASPTHCFMVFASNSTEITPQKNFAYNKYSVSDGLKGIRLGFNLTVRF
jgi:hypothetical protein